MLGGLNDDVIDFDEEGVVLSSIRFNLPTDRRGRGCRRGECSIVLERWRQFFLWLVFFGKLG